MLAKYPNAVRYARTFIVVFFVLIMGVNLATHQPLFANLPWIVLMLFGLGMLRVVTTWSQRTLLAVYLVAYLSFNLSFGLYTTVTGWVLGGVLAIFYTWMTYLLGGKLAKMD